MGLRKAKYAEMVQYANDYRALWRGDAVGGWVVSRRPTTGRHPSCGWARSPTPKGAETAAAAYDGVLLPPVLRRRRPRRRSPRLREACERIDRDPATLRICQCVITAPELDDEEARALAAWPRRVLLRVTPATARTSRRSTGGTST